MVWSVDRCVVVAESAEQEGSGGSVEERCVRRADGR